MCLYQQGVQPFHPHRHSLVLGPREVLRFGSREIGLLPDKGGTRTAGAGDEGDSFLDLQSWSLPAPPENCRSGSLGSNGSLSDELGPSRRFLRLKLHS